MTVVSGPHIGLVVEGPGDVGAVPYLFRMYQQSIGDYRDILGKPVPLNGISKATRVGGIEGYAAAAARRPGCAALLVVVDGDDNCLADLSSELSKRVASVIGQRVQVSIAARDFEDWIYASAETLNIPDLAYSASKRGLSELRRCLKPESYVKPVLQPRLTARIDLSLARSRSQSLDRALNRFDELRALIP